MFLHALIFYSVFGYPRLILDLILPRVVTLMYCIFLLFVLLVVVASGIISWRTNREIDQLEIGKRIPQIHTFNGEPYFKLRPKFPVIRRKKLQSPAIPTLMEDVLSRCSGCEGTCDLCMECGGLPMSWHDEEDLHFLQDKME
ncbi:Uncharacterized protein TCM_015722 [Theobroma cacao]|uniref:Uncharacterized protein n=1 Tax=Theobroma cacao TaxID=3641 RepID=A0A061G2A8_THECC|nr:Uncharacterized protein TCM_015722 [Theobroma cacao]